MVSRRPRPSPASEPPRAKALSTLPLPLSRALQRFRAADDDFCASCAEHASVFRIDERYAALVARARELVGAAQLLGEGTPLPTTQGGRADDDEEVWLSTARAVAVRLER